MRDLKWNDEKGYLTFSLSKNELKRFHVTKKSLAKGTFDYTGIINYAVSAYKQIDKENLLDISASSWEILAYEEKDNIAFQIIPLYEDDISEYDIEEYDVDEMIDKLMDMLDLSDEELSDYIDDKLYEAHNADKPPSDTNDKGWFCVTFPTLNAATAAIIRKEDKRGSVLIKQKNVYYLIIHTKPTDKAFAYLTEQGILTPMNKMKEAYLKEHGKKIIKKDAINTLYALRRNKK